MNDHLTQMKDAVSQVEGIKDGKLKQILLYLRLASNDKTFQWIRNHIQRVSTNSYDDMDSIKDKISNFLHRYTPEPKGCFLTAWMCCMYLEGVSYVEGYIHRLGLPFQHAWNEWNDHHFDLTDELIFDDGNETTHYRLFSVDKVKMNSFSVGMDAIGSFLIPYLTDIGIIDI